MGLGIGLAGPDPDHRSNQNPVYQGDFGMPNVMAHPALVEEELDLEEALVARFEEGEEEDEWDADREEGWEEEDDLDDEDDWDDDEAVDEDDDDI